MDRTTSRIWAQEPESGSVDTAADLRLIRPELQSEAGRGKLCLWGEEHVVFQTSFDNDGMQSTLVV